MSGKKKYLDEFKLKLVQEYLEGKKGGFERISNEYGINPSILKHWVHLYEAHGTEGLTKVTRTYDGKTKIHIVEYMHRNSLSIRQTAALFGVSSPPTIARWERIYCEEGKEALLEERRGRKHMSIKKSKETKKKKINKKLQKTEMLKFQRLYFL